MQTRDTKDPEKAWNAAHTPCNARLEVVVGGFQHGACYLRDSAAQEKCPEPKQGCRWNTFSLWASADKFVKHHKRRLDWIARTANMPMHQTVSMRGSTALCRKERNHTGALSITWQWQRQSVAAAAAALQCTTRQMPPAVSLICHVNEGT